MRAEFTSPLAAVCCAVEIQEALARRMARRAATRAHPAAHRHPLRRGVVDRGELTGEALTIARRVQA